MVGSICWELRKVSRVPPQCGLFSSVGKELYLGRIHVFPINLFHLNISLVNFLTLKSALIDVESDIKNRVFRVTNKTENLFGFIFFLGWNIKILWNNGVCKWAVGWH